MSYIKKPLRVIPKVLREQQMAGRPLIKSDQVGRANGPKVENRDTAQKLSKITLDFDTEHYPVGNLLAKLNPEQVFNNFQKLFNFYQCETRIGNHSYLIQLSELSEDGRLTDSSKISIRPNSAYPLGNNHYDSYETELVSDLSDTYKNIIEKLLESFKYCDAQKIYPIPPSSPEQAEVINGLEAVFNGETRLEAVSRNESHLLAQVSINGQKYDLYFENSTNGEGTNSFKESSCLIIDKPGDPKFERITIPFDKLNASQQRLINEKVMPQFKEASSK
jgi:hypothetical protein